jgi:serine/threonine protein kinase
MTNLVPSSTNAKAMLRPGQVVAGCYRVDGLLAEGGMAAVWAGINQRTGKRVALKVILPSYAGVGEAMELFRREALAASKVNHPNVVSIFDVIEHEGMTCIVMEKLDGETLGTYLAQRGRLSLEEAVTLLLPAMRGVAAANAQGVVHRDLKPGNIFLCKDPEGRPLTTKVLDFGISVSAERAKSPSDAQATKHTLFGTPAYMAPEDIEGTSTIDSRTDVYGFGVLLFEVLTGQVPFPGEPSQELFTRILTEAPPKMADLRPELPSTVQYILDYALAKNPDERFPDVEQMIRAAEDHLLPRLRLERSLSPMAGVAFMPLGEAGSALRNISVSPPAKRTRGIGSAAGNTRVLYALPAQASRHITAAVTVTVVTVRRSLGSVRSWLLNRAFDPLRSWVSRQWPLVRTLLRDRRVTFAAGVLALALIVPWLVIRRPDHAKSLRALPPASIVQTTSTGGPSSLHGTDKVSPEPPVTLANAGVARGVVVEQLDTSPSTGTAQGTGLVPTTTVVDTTRSPMSSHRVSQPDHVQRRTARKAKRASFTPRAGTLSASDF